MLKQHYSLIWLCSILICFKIHTADTDIIPSFRETKAPAAASLLHHCAPILGKQLQKNPAAIDHPDLIQACTAYLPDSYWPPKGAKPIYSREIRDTNKALLLGNGRIILTSVYVNNEICIKCIDPFDATKDIILEAPKTAFNLRNWVNGDHRPGELRPAHHPDEFIAIDDTCCALFNIYNTVGPQHIIAQEDFKNPKAALTSCDLLIDACELLINDERYLTAISRKSGEIVLKNVHTGSVHNFDLNNKLISLSSQFTNLSIYQIVSAQEGFAVRFESTNGPFSSKEHIGYFKIRDNSIQCAAILPWSRKKLIKKPGYLIEKDQGYIKHIYGTAEENLVLEINRYRKGTKMEIRSCTDLDTPLRIEKPYKEVVSMRRRGNAFIRDGTHITELILYKNYGNISLYKNTWYQHPTTKSDDKKHKMH